MADCVRAALVELPSEHRESAQIVYTAHSIPLAMASGAEYETQILEASGLVNEQIESGRAVCLTEIDGPVEQWERCALEELGRLRVYIVFDYNAQEFWVLPRSATAAIAVEDERIDT